MRTDPSDRLIRSTNAALDAPAEWVRALRFFYESLLAANAFLPNVAQEQLKARGPEPPSSRALEASRVALWQSIETDPLGNTPEGAAVRATLFAFFAAGSDGPLEAIALFCSFYSRAGLPEESLVHAFGRQWPQNDA